MRRTPATIRRSGLDLINIALNFAPIVGDCDGQDVRSPPGVVQFRDMSLPSASHVERVDLINLMIPRPLAPAWMLDGAVHGLALGGETAAGRLLASHLIVLANVAAELTLDEGEAAISAALLIAERGVGRSRPATPAQSEAVYRTVRRRAAAVIQRRLLDPTLTIQAIADGAGASRSTLFRAFEPGGVRKHVQDMRLDRARAMLDRRDGRRVTVAEVAFRHGFASAAHFSRLFRARFGHAPTEAPNLSEGEKRARFEQAAGIRHDLVVDWLRERSAA
jgi:AraC-like DNA-binding protein